MSERDRESLMAGRLTDARGRLTMTWPVRVSRVEPTAAPGATPKRKPRAAKVPGRGPGITVEPGGKRERRCTCAQCGRGFAASPMGRRPLRCPECRARG